MQISCLKFKLDFSFAATVVHYSGAPYAKCMLKDVQYISSISRCFKRSCISPESTSDSILGWAAISSFAPKWTLTLFLTPAILNPTSLGQVTRRGNFFGEWLTTTFPTEYVDLLHD